MLQATVREGVKLEGKANDTVQMLTVTCAPLGNPRMDADCIPMALGTAHHGRQVLWNHAQLVQWLLQGNGQHLLTVSMHGDIQTCTLKPSSNCSSSAVCAELLQLQLTEHRAASQCWVKAGTGNISAGWAEAPSNCQQNLTWPQQTRVQSCCHGSNWPVLHHKSGQTLLAKANTCKRQ